jgi:hypothetical protein
MSGSDRSRSAPVIHPRLVSHPEIAFLISPITLATCHIHNLTIKEPSMRVTN